MCIYDLMARIIETLIENEGEDGWNGINIDYYDNTVAKIQETLGVKIERADWSIYYNVLNELSDVIDENSEDYGLLFVLLLLLDSMVMFSDESIPSIPNSTGEYHSFTSLSCNDNIFIIPKKICKWDNGRSSHTTTNDLNSSLKNYYYIKRNDKFQVCNYVIPEEDWNNGDDVVSIMTSPLGSEFDLNVNRTSIDYHKRINDVFTVEGFLKADSEKIIEDRIIGFLQYCNSDILMFPEMLGTPQIVKNVISDLKKEESSVKLCVLPSVWDNNKNIVTVVNSYGDIIFEQEKTGTFKWEFEGKEYVEGIINEKPYTVHILHICNIGRVAVLICADLFNKSKFNYVVDQLHCTLVLCPSFSEGYNLFKKEFQSLEKYNCKIVWCNTCTAYKDKTKNKYISFSSCKGDIVCINNECSERCSNEHIIK